MHPKITKKKREEKQVGGTEGHQEGEQWNNTRNEIACFIILLVLGVFGWKMRNTKGIFNMLAIERVHVYISRIC